MSELKAVAQQIVTRIVERAIRMQFTRQGLEGAEVDGEPLDEESMVQDALGVALGEDTGCLDEDEINAENIDLIFVQEALARASSPDPAREALVGATWDLITIESLPHVGDEVGGWDEEGTGFWRVRHVTKGMEVERNRAPQDRDWERLGYTHFRSINPPPSPSRATKEPPSE